MDRILSKEEGKGFEFENAIVGGAIPKEYIPAVKAGIGRPCRKWCPLVDIH